MMTARPSRSPHREGRCSVGRRSLPKRRIHGKLRGVRSIDPALAVCSTVAAHTKMRLTCRQATFLFVDERRSATPPTGPDLFVSTGRLAYAGNSRIDMDQPLNEQAAARRHSLKLSPKRWPPVPVTAIECGTSQPLCSCDTVSLCLIDDHLCPQVRSMNSSAPRRPVAPCSSSAQWQHSPSPIRDGRMPTTICGTRRSQSWSADTSCH